MAAGQGVVNSMRTPLVCLLACLFLSTFARTQPIAEVPSEPPTWGQQIYQGIALTSAFRKRPEPFALYAVAIDLRANGLSFLVSPSNGERRLETDTQKTGTFLHQNKCQVAINGSPFWPVERREGVPIDVAGLSVSRGDRYSEPEVTCGALLITQDNQVKLVSQGDDLSDAYNALGGFDFLLKAGQLVNEPGGPRHPRTAVGLSQDGQTLYLCVIDGRQNDHSVGATLYETALWMRWLGCWEALNLDGGGSTTLVIEDEMGLPHTINRPIHGQIPGQQRPSANHLGVYAAPVKR